MVGNPSRTQTWSYKRNGKLVRKVVEHWNPSLADCKYESPRTRGNTCSPRVLPQFNREHANHLLADDWWSVVAVVLTHKNGMVYLQVRSWSSPSHDGKLQMNKCLFIVLVFMTSLACADVYKYGDSNGRTYLSDVPDMKGLQLVKVFKDNGSRVSVNLPSSSPTKPKKDNEEPTSIVSSVVESSSVAPMIRLYRSTPAAQKLENHRPAHNIPPVKSNSMISPFKTDAEKEKRLAKDHWGVVLFIALALLGFAIVVMVADALSATPMFPQLNQPIFVNPKRQHAEKQANLYVYTEVIKHFTTKITEGIKNNGFYCFSTDEHADLLKMVEEVLSRAPSFHASYVPWSVIHDIAIRAKEEYRVENARGSCLIPSSWLGRFSNINWKFYPKNATDEYVDGEYSHEKAYRQLGLKESTISWFLEMDDGHSTDA